MHDLHAADKIQRLIIEQAKKNRLNAVLEIVIELGCVIEHGADITPENLEFNLQMLNKGTLAEKAKIIINKVSGNSWKLVSISGE
ncbi:hydrogenase maturation nickel metallochaperone HypA [Patescibacteria group bacterium]|nr:hydrogenase maturation nickel metallochaperone HypA [Patescibacteria group bacterium]